MFSFQLCFGIVIPFVHILRYIMFCFLPSLIQPIELGVENTSIASLQRGNPDEYPKYAMK